MEIEKICRTCLALNGPFLSIYDDGGGAEDGNCVAICDMLSDFTKTRRPKRSDNMPEKVCLTCISEIMRCYSFKMKCENSSRTLRQLLPNALPEEIFTEGSGAHIKVQTENKSVQTVAAHHIKHTKTAEVQTTSVSMRDEEVQTLESVTLDVATSPLETARRSRSLLQVQQPMAKKQKLVLLMQEEENTNLELANEQDPPRKQSSEQKESQSKWKCQQVNVRDENDYIVVVHDEANVTSEDNSDTKEYLRQKTQEDVLAGEQQTYYELSSSTYDYEDENAGVELQDQPKKVVVASCQDEQEEFVQLEYTELVGGEEPHSDDANFNYTIYNNDSGETLVTERRKTLRTKTEQKCSECAMTFISAKTLKRHMLKRHCTVSLQSTNSQSPSESFVVSRNDAELKIEKVVKQNILERPRTRRETASLSMPVAQPTIAQAPGELAHFCDRCNAGFAVRKSLNYHRKLNICTVQSFKCDECERVFNSDANLVEHKATHILGHVCNDCTHVCETKEDLSQHMIEEHNRSIRNQCDICKKVFTILSALKDHMRVHSGEKPYLCTVCGKGFSQNANLKQHMMRHSKEKRFHCEFCEKGYVTKAELLSHHRTHTGDHPFKCTFCRQGFTSNSSLVKHKRKHTGERPYACEMCPMRFSALNVLKNHRRTHTGEKPYSCVFCNKSFTQKGDCQIHQRTHTGERNYACYCGEKFVHMGTLRSHMKTHDKETNAAGDATSDRAKRHRASPQSSDSDAGNTRTAKQEKNRRITIIEMKSSAETSNDRQMSPQQNDPDELEEELVQISIDEMCQTVKVP